MASSRQALSSGAIVQALDQLWTSSISAARETLTPASLENRADELARSGLSMLQTLGPLLFPIYRASLLRKRILLISQPPLLPFCRFGIITRFTRVMNLD